MEKSIRIDAAHEDTNSLVRQFVDCAIEFVATPTEELTHKLLNCESNSWMILFLHRRDVVDLPTSPLLQHHLIVRMLLAFCQNSDCYSSDNLRSHLVMILKSRDEAFEQLQSGASAYEPAIA